MDDAPQKKGKDIISVHVARYKKKYVQVINMFEDWVSHRVSGSPMQERAYKATMLWDMVW